MNAFTFYNPVRIHFGENAVAALPAELHAVGDTVLLTYGMGSIKKNGIYDAVTAALKKAGKKVVELGGIMPNPRTEKVYEGIELCRKNRVDFILAVGGGSTLDCTKAIAAGAELEEDFWQALFMERKPIRKALPFGTVLTMAATGSEMNCGGVVTNQEQKQKRSYSSPLLFPKFSFLDPTYTYSLPKEQMVYGAVDMLSHIMEVYFSKPDTSNVSDDLSEAVFKSIVSNLNAALQDPENAAARANLMWGSTLGLNGLLGCGKEEDWMGHQIQHPLSAFFDIPHGAGLAIVHPAYLRYIYKNAPSKFAQFAKNVWDIDDPAVSDYGLALAGLDRLTDYFAGIGAPTRLRDVGIPESAVRDLAAATGPYPTSYASLTVEDVEAILLSCL